ncbi:MAG: tetratricopeptide repeat protein [Candidatus Rifleibacteriota bacterium]
MEEKKLKDYIKKVDFSDLRVLLVGVVLLVIPIAFLLWLGTSGSNKRLSQDRMRTMVNRKSIFNFGPEKGQQKSMPASSVKSGEKSGSGWFADESPEKKVQRELEDAMKIVERSRRPENFPPGTTEMQKQAYRAEHHPSMIYGNAALEEGRVAEAEKFFEQAFEDARDNPFQRVYALGGLLEVYSRKGDYAKHEQVFKLFMEWVGKMPKNAGGGDLQAAVRDAYLSLKKVKEMLDSGGGMDKISQVNLVKDGQIDPAKVGRELSKSLSVFPAKFD